MECIYSRTKDTRKLLLIPATYGSVSQCNLVHELVLTDIHFLAMRWQVPDHIYETWNTEPIVLGSDTDDDSVEDDTISQLSNLVSALVVLPQTPKKGGCSPHHTKDIN